MPAARADLPWEERGAILELLGTAERTFFLIDRIDAERRSVPRAVDTPQEAEPFTSPDMKHPPSCEPRSGEFVWALEKDVKRVVCELHDHGAQGCEAQLLRNGEFSACRRFAARAQALAHADAIRMLLEGAGEVRVVNGTATLQVDSRGGTAEPSIGFHHIPQVETGVMVAVPLAA